MALTVGEREAALRHLGIEYHRRGEELQVLGRDEPPEAELETALGERRQAEQAQRDARAQARERLRNPPQGFNARQLAQDLRTLLPSLEQDDPQEDESP